MGRAVDGFKLWVTQDQHDAERGRAEHAERRASRFEAALQLIARRAGEDDSLGMLVDWHQQALSMRHAAVDALGER